MRWENRKEGWVHNRHTTIENSPPYRRVESAAKPKCQRKIPKLIYLAICEGGEMLWSGLRFRICIRVKSEYGSASKSNLKFQKLSRLKIEP